ncbi:murein biosynthesis integral membrane protein MurJ [Sediminivirga luteola]|uniref:murein biosynthesis integral membrane protein MurJ n=1 Tax=Sediminivirga luteola TaxID=1774748 RepID=UPI00227C508A
MGQSASRLRSLARSSAIMTAGTLVSRLLGFAKTMLLVTAIGVTVGGAADAFDVANKVPNNIYMLLAGGVLNAVLVPQLVRAAKRDDGGQDFTDRLLTLAIGLLLILTVAFTAAAGLMVRIYANSGTWSDEQLALATAFAYWCLPQIFFYGLYTLLGQVLNSRESFGPYMWAPVLNNVVAIAGIIAFILLFGPGPEGEHAVGTWTGGKIALLAGTATLGVVAQALILIWPLRRIGFSFRPRFGWRGVGLSIAGRVAGWTFAAVLVGQLGYIAVSQVASTATSGAQGDVSASNAAYSVSYLIFMLPHSLIAVSIATALFTPMSRNAAAGDVSAVRGSLTMGLRTVAIVNFLATACVLVLAPQIAYVVAGGSIAQAEAIGHVLQAMILGLVPFSSAYLLQRVYYAYEDARTPFLVQLPQVVITTALVLACLALPREWTVAGIGASMSLGYVFGATASALLLRRRLGGLGLAGIAGNHARLAVAAVGAAAAGWAVSLPLEPMLFAGRAGALGSIAIIGAVMALSYLVLTWLLRVGELRELGRAVAARLR